ncbi:hypothetical protein [Anabaena sp. PCC 7108]|uniref:hypothetical protein n=1 Tax=Anabaena sp. PCC 7108 TaxID=163908 RepID=UPI0003471F83|nr:hypothetical protein [Anabaena sp. PCC 7108]
MTILDLSFFTINRHILYIALLSALFVSPSELELEITARGFQTIWIKTVSLFTEAILLYENSGYMKFLDLETPKIGYIYYKNISESMSSKI